MYIYITGVVGRRCQWSLKHYRSWQHNYLPRKRALNRDGALVYVHICIHTYRCVCKYENKYIHIHTYVYIYITGVVGRRCQWPLRHYQNWQHNCLPRKHALNIDGALVHIDIGVYVYGCLSRHISISISISISIYIYIWPLKPSRSWQHSCFPQRCASSADGGLHITTYISICMYLYISEHTYIKLSMYVSTLEQTSKSLRSLYLL